MALVNFYVKLGGYTLSSTKSIITIKVEEASLVCGVSIYIHTFNIKLFEGQPSMESTIKMEKIVARILPKA